jgi:hypothetical protein
MTVIRYDSAPMSVLTRQDQDGFLYTEAATGRTGILHYRNADGTPRRELRLPEDAGSAASLQSMIGKPVVITHKGGMVNGKTARSRNVGTMLSARFDSMQGVTFNQIVIHDEQAQTAGRTTHKYLSLGYRLDLEERRGYYSAATNEISDTPKDGFEPFDAIQRNLVVNHLAMVPMGRAGEVARLNLDGNEDYFDHEDNPMPKIKLANGTEIEVAQEVADHIGGLQTRLDGAEATLSTTKGTLTAVSAERDALKNTVDGFDEKLKQARLDAADELKASAKLIASVAHKVTDVEGKSDVEVKAAFVKAVMPAINLDGKDDLEICGAFDYALAAHPAPTGGKRDERRDHIGGGKEKGQRNDSAEDDHSAAAAEQRMLAKLGLVR